MIHDIDPHTLTLKNKITGEIIVFKGCTKEPEYFLARTSDYERIENV